MKKVKVLLIATMLLVVLCVAACSAGTVIVRFDLGVDSAEISALAEEGFYFERTIKKGTVMGEPTNIVVGDKYVAGWYQDKEFAEKWDFSNPVNKNMTLHAKWATTIFEIKLNYNNGNQPFVFKAGENSKVDLPVPQKQYCTFEGWYLDSNFTTEFLEAETEITKDIELFAKWSEEVYNVTLEYNNGNTPTVLKVQGDEVPLIVTPQKQFYRFEGWYLDESFGTKLTDGFKLNGDLTLFAKWSIYMMERHSSFPAVVINTKDNALSNDKEVWIDASVSITNTIKEYTITAEGFNAELRGRGNNTWGLPKKPYRIKFGSKTSVLGSDYKAKNWTLLANHNDKSMLRNHLAYNFADSLENMGFAPTAIFVDVYLNGEYNGVYTLSDHMETGEGRVDIDTTTYENPEDCDYFFELDNYASTEPGAIEDLTYVVVDGRGFTIKSPKTDEDGWTAAHAAYLKQYIQNFYNVVRSDDFSKIEEMIDVPSFIDNIMVYEFFKNRDADNFSAYLYVKEDKLYAGPVWDFDWSTGSDNISSSCIGSRINNETFYSYALMQHQEFYSSFVDRWNEIVDKKLDNIFYNLLNISVNNSYSMLNNYEVWDINDFSYIDEGVKVADYCKIETYNGHIEYLKNWLIGRVDWMNEFYGENETWVGG